MEPKATVPLNIKQSISDEISNKMIGIDDPEFPYSVIQDNLLSQKIQGWETNDTKSRI
jgi:hypothetical protein